MGSVALGLLLPLCLCVRPVLPLSFIHLLFHVSTALSSGLPSLALVSSGHMVSSQPLVSLLVHTYPAREKERQVVQCKWESEEQISKKMMQEPVVQASLNWFPI